MRSFAFLPLICILMQAVNAQKCDLSGAKTPIDFPDIEKKGVESYQMSVEYTAPKAKQTDYYVEFYDLVDRRGRVDGHQAGNMQTYIYRTQTLEAWEITDVKCKLQNITEIPTLWKDDMIEWLYTPEDGDKRTFGPSAMFKYALDSWNAGKGKKMAYMGVSENKIRGLKAQYWRRCNDDSSYVDYYFTTDDEQDPNGVDLKRIPLRVNFRGKRAGKDEQLSEQQYEIITFQPFITRNFYPFRLPKGKECRRGYLKDAPKLPDFSDSNLLFSAEAIYKKVDYSEEDVEYWNYYSTLTLAMDLDSLHLAYYYTPWNTTKRDDKEEPSVLSPEYVIFDMKHGYAYKTNLTSGQCELTRSKTFVPTYKLPNNAGVIGLTDPAILFPNSEPTFITKGMSRGLKVNIFETIVENFVIDAEKEIKVPKAIISHSYLTDDEIERNSMSVKNALVQVQVRLLGRYEKVMELLTFNFYNFDTEIKNRRYIFNTQRCFKNDDDYVWVTIGFNADESQLDKIKDDAPSIQSNILNSITSESELNPVRIPIIMVDIKDGLFVTMLILDKPPVLLDYYEPEAGKTLSGSKDIEGVKDLETCATMCLETEDNCWGFSFCGALCTFATEGAKVVSGDKSCNLYRRFNNETYIPSKELMLRNLRREVETKQIKLLLRGKDEELVQLDPSSIEVTEPGEDDRLINRLGNEPDPRMRVVKAGAKLKVIEGKPVKNLGKLSFSDCQRVCLDYKDCETVSFCVRNQECVLTSHFGDEIDKDLIQTDNLCIIVTRKYGDLFERSPGNVLSITAQEVVKQDTVEKCARACLNAKGYQCLSFDHCPQSADAPCMLHTVHYPNSKTREAIQTRNTNCGHYFRKYSTEFKKSPNKRYYGSSIQPISNLTLEECSKTCREYNKGTCYGFDFCQQGTIMATSCILLDKEPSQLKSSSSDVCTNFLINEAQGVPRPYSNSYAGGIGFLCFIIGLAVGALVVFVVAYIKVNRH